MAAPRELDDGALERPELRQRAATANTTDSTGTIWALNAPVGALAVTITAGSMDYRASTIGSFATSYTFALRLP